jgi:3-hydroxyacyl-[acyl-carrier-protein] dehydratase
MSRDHKESPEIPEEKTLEGVFYFHPDDGIYQDHFPGCPVVPGSLIVHAFLKAAAEAGFLPDYLAIENFRFREFLSPGHYTFRIELDEERLNCLIYRGERKLVTGVLKR